MVWSGTLFVTLASLVGEMRNRQTEKRKEKGYQKTKVYCAVWINGEMGERKRRRTGVNRRSGD